MQRLRQAKRSLIYSPSKENLKFKEPNKDSFGEKNGIIGFVVDHL